VHDELFIGGAWERADRTFEVVDPATGEAFASVSDADAAAAVRALDAAAAAQESWAATAPRERSQILRRAYELMHERAEELARMLGGLEVTGKAREHAREMLHLAGNPDPKARSGGKRKA